MKTILAIIAVVLYPSATAAGLDFQCPERYLSRPAQLAEAPPGWQDAVATVRPELRLSGGGIVGGPATLYPPAELHGETVEKKGGRSETRYPVGGETWAFCTYGEGGEVQLFRRVDGAGVRECVVKTTKPRPAAAFQVGVACR